MITGVHLMLFSGDADADRAFMRDVLGWPCVRASGADDPWLVFALPPAEAGIHPTDGEPSTSMYLMCDDIHATVAELSERGVRFTGEPQKQRWGLVTAVILPSGTEVGLYEPHHATTHEEG